MPFGDYTIEREEQKVNVERKSQNDLIGTMSTGYERFCREIERAQKEDKYIVVLVEVNFRKLNKKKLTKILDFFHIFINDIGLC